MENNSISFKQIGYVRNNIENRKELPIGGIKSSLFIYDEYLPALKLLEENSHIIISCYLNLANTETLLVIPNKFGKEKIEKGVFATRSPDRPNPISFTVARLLSIDSGILEIDKIDVINNTPVLDIKPYAFGTDCVFNTSSINKRKDFALASDEQFYDYLKAGIVNYIYDIDKTLDLGLYSLIKLSRQFDKIPDRETIAYLETNFTGNALDCLYFYMKLTPGECRLIHDCRCISKNSYINLKTIDGEVWNLVYSNEKQPYNLVTIRLSRLPDE